MVVTEESTAVAGTVEGTAACCVVTLPISVLLGGMLKVNVIVAALTALVASLALVLLAVLNVDFGTVKVLLVLTCFTVKVDDVPCSLSW